MHQVELGGYRSDVVMATSTVFLHFATTDCITAASTPSSILSPLVSRPISFPFPSIHPIPSFPRHPRNAHFLNSTSCSPRGTAPDWKPPQQYRPPFHSLPSTQLLLAPVPIRCMYNHLLDRRREAVNTCVQLLKDHSRDMALDPRFYQHIAQSPGPGSISSATSSELSAATGITSPSIVSTSASAATLRSTASSPSLRARESVAVSARQDGMASPSPGGNVRVVVRVRKFLPRGECRDCDVARGRAHRSGIGDACLTRLQRSNATQNA